jgi:hypothetical protein
MNSFIPTFSVVVHHILHHLGLTFNEQTLPLIRHPHVLSKVLLRQKWWWWWWKWFPCRCIGCLLGLGSSLHPLLFGFFTNYRRYYIPLTLMFKKSVIVNCSVGLSLGINQKSSY